MQSAERREVLLAVLRRAARRVMCLRRLLGEQLGDLPAYLYGQTKYNSIVRIPQRDTAIAWMPFAWGAWERKDGVHFVMIFTVRVEHS